MIIKYNRTSTINQKGERFKLDKNKYDLTINDFGVSGKIPFEQREGGYKLMELVKEGKVDMVVFDDVSRSGRTIKNCWETMDWLIENGVVIKLLKPTIQSHNEDGSKNSMWDIIMVNMMVKRF